MQHTDLAAALFTAFEAADETTVRELCSPELEAIQNGEPAMNLESLLQFSMAVHRVLQNFRYEEPIRSATADGFVEEHVLRGTLPDGSAIALAACVVGEIEGGRIVRLREYFDRLAAAKLGKALGAAR